MTGTATNGLAAIGGAFSGDAKNITQWLGELGEKFTKFADENPRVIRGVVGLAAGLAILKLGLMGVGGAISIVSRIMSMTPIGMIATAIALAAGLIITNWDVVGPYFKKLWETIGPYFEAGWELLKKVFAWSPLGMVINNWGPVVKWFQDMWDKLKPIIEWFTDGASDTVVAANATQWGGGGYGAYGTGVSAQGYNPYQIVQAAPKKAEGEITVSFKDAPPGMRVPALTTSAVMQNAAVGQATTPAQSTCWPSVTHPALNNAPAVKNTVDLPTWEELTDIRDTLNTAIDKELSRTTSDALFLALRRVKADLNADINTRLEQSARIIQRTPDEVLPALVLAATWFDNAARDADIIRRNAITHPGFVPVIPLKVPVQ